MRFKKGHFRGVFKVYGGCPIDTDSGFFTLPCSDCWYYIFGRCCNYTIRVPASCFVGHRVVNRFDLDILLDLPF